MFYRLYSVLNSSETLELLTLTQPLEAEKSIWEWVIFHFIIFTLLGLDLGVGQRKAHVPSFKEAISWVSLYITCAILYGVYIGWKWGTEKAILFYTGYLVEYSLSVDNLFVFLVLFSFFAVPPKSRHRVLFWGILGALFFRAIFIALGAIIISRFDWVLYLFGAFLIYTAWKLLHSGEQEIHPDENPVINWVKKHFPVTNFYVESKFTTKVDGKTYLTPLALVLISVETTDIIFAVDSIPAIFSITSDPFIVYTSNVFAILGLRSLFFVLDKLLPLFRFLKPALAVILGFIGIKMLIHSFIKIPPMVSLSFVVGILSIAILLSVILKKK
ncbi:MAG: TerC family protein [bacterium]|nr:TerC family protein [bacterium]